MTPQSADDRHPLEIEYGLTAAEILDAVSLRFRARVTLEGAVAEVQLGRQIDMLYREGMIWSFEEHDLDGYPDYTIWLDEFAAGLKVECKNVRDSEEAYRQRGDIVAYKVETQKTRTSNDDPSTRYYGVDQFDILAVCLGKKTKNWHDFVFAKTDDLDRHKLYSNKLAVMQRVPLPTQPEAHPWFRSLGDLLGAIKLVR